MSFKNSRRAKSILASLLVASNFTNVVIQNVKCMETSYQNAVSDIDTEDFRCITDGFVFDVLNSYINYKQEFKNYGCSPTINEKFLNDFEYLNKNVFKNSLIHGFGTKILNNESIIANFHPYLVVHTLRAFFDKNINIKKAFAFAHRKISKLAFLLYDFDNTKEYTMTERISEMLTKNKKQINNYGSQHYINNRSYDGIHGNASSLGYLGTLGINWNAIGFDEYSNSSKCCHILEVINANNSRCVTTNDLLWYGLNFNNRQNICSIVKKTDELSYDEIDGILYMIKAIIHEIGHTICKYLGLLEKFIGWKETETPINLASGIGTDEDRDSNSLAFNWNHYYHDEFLKLKNNHKNAGIDDKTFDILARYKKSYKPAQEFKKNYIDYYRNLYETSSKTREEAIKLYELENNEMGKYEPSDETEYLGHSEYAATSTNEDIAEAIAYGSMPSWITFKGHKAMIKSYNIYAKKLLELYRTYYEEYKNQALKYINDFDKEQEEQRMQRYNKLLKDLNNLYNVKKS